MSITSSTAMMMALAAAQRRAMNAAVSPQTQPGSVQQYLQGATTASGSELVANALPLPPPPGGESGRGHMAALLGFLRGMSLPSSEQMGDTLRNAASTLQDIARPTIQMLAAPLQGFRSITDFGKLGRRRGSKRGGDDAEGGRGISGGGPMGPGPEDGSRLLYGGVRRNWMAIAVPAIMLLLILATLTYSVAVIIDSMVS